MDLREEMAWRQFGACRGKPQEWFYPERGDSTAEAKAMCGICPVMQQCREWGLKHERIGIWGGLSERERRRLRRRAGVTFEGIAINPFDDLCVDRGVDSSDPFEETA